VNFLKYSCDWVLNSMKWRMEVFTFQLLTCVVNVFMNWIIPFVYFSKIC
jgi:hypothetical protein